MKPSTQVSSPRLSIGHSISSHWPVIALSVILGSIGGVCNRIILESSPFTSVIAGAIFGSIFGICFAKRCTSPGAGLLWGVGASILMWCVLPVIEFLLGKSAHGSIPDMEFGGRRFPDLVANLLGIGTPVGVALGICGSYQVNRTPLQWGRAIVSGGFSGLVSALIFGYWLLKGDFFPLIGGLASTPSHMAGVILQFGVAWLIGITFGILFQHDVRGYGSSMGWGLGFAFLCWFAGPLTLFPLLTRSPLNWNVGAASDLFSDLIGYIFYGLILGVLYATVDRMWLRLFVHSDPLNREADGIGFRVLLSLEWGAIAGLVGGIIASPLMLAAGAVSHVVGIDVHLSTSNGLAVHMLVSVLVGMSFGLLFRDESSSFVMAGAWGWLFGLIWWYVGPLTLLPLILTGAIDWRTSAILLLIPSIFGHIIYGAFTGFTFYLIEQRYLRRHILSPRTAAREARKLRPSGTPAPALWFLAITLGVAIPILLS